MTSDRQNKRRKIDISSLSDQARSERQQAPAQEKVVAAVKRLLGNKRKRSRARAARAETVSRLIALAAARNAAELTI